MLARIAIQRLASRTSSIRAPSLSMLGLRDYHGDPGPSTFAQRKTQRRNLREQTSALGGGSPQGGRTTGSMSAEALNSVLSAEPGGYKTVGDRGHRGEGTGGTRDRQSGGRRSSGDERSTYNRQTPGGKRLSDTGHGARHSGAYGFGRSMRDGTPTSGDRRPSRQTDMPGRTAIASPPQSGQSQRGPRSPGKYRLSPSAGRAAASPAVVFDGDPFETSKQLREYVQKHPSPMTEPQLLEACDIVVNARPGAKNVVVWNQLLGLLGREGKLERMWQYFNDMKKTSIKPSLYTFTTMFNCYAGLAHSHSPTPLASASGIRPAPPTDKTLSRVSLLWDQAQAVIQSEREASADSETGLEVPSSETDFNVEGEAIARERIIGNALGPVNAYLKFLSKYRMLDEMWKVYQTAKKRGEKWDRVGYSIMLVTLQIVARRQRPGGEFSGRDNSKKRKIAVGPMAVEMWEDAVATLAGKTEAEGGIDTRLVIPAIGAMLLGRLKDQRLALEVIPEIWSLPLLTATQTTSAPVLVSPSIRDSSSQGASSSSPADGSPSLPKLTIDQRAGTFLISNLTASSRPSLAAHYANHLLSLARIRRKVDAPFIYACATAFADAGDITATLQLLGDFAPPSESGGWKPGFWYDCLTAARWARPDAPPGGGTGAGRGDWQGVKDVLGWMGRLPPGSPGTAQDRQTGFNPEIIRLCERNKKDDTGRKWPPIGAVIPPELDAKAMTIILKASLGKSKTEVVEALEILQCGGLERVLKQYEAQEAGASPVETGNRAKARAAAGEKSWDWHAELHKEVVRALEWIGSSEAAARVCSEDTRAVVRRLSENPPSSEESADNQVRKRKGPGHAKMPFLDAWKR